MVDDGAASTSGADAMDHDAADDDDPVVREIDVYLCSDFSTAGIQLVLLQHPLRPPWRPYDYDMVKSLRIKPRAQRMEVDIPIDTQGRNYTDAVDPIKKIKHVKLRSTLAESRVTYCLATLRQDQLLLAPIDFSLHLRPCLEHLKDQPVGKHAHRDDDEDAGGGGGGGGGEEGGDDDDDDKAGGASGSGAPSLQAVDVLVQKRETERQQEARLRSYAYIQAQEDQEAWKSLALHREDSELAAKLWAKYMVPNEVPLPLDMPRSAYLRCIAPATYSAANGGGFVGFGCAPSANAPRPPAAPHGGATPGGRGLTLPAASNTAATIVQPGSAATASTAAGSDRPSAARSGGSGAGGSGAAAAPSAAAAAGPSSAAAADVPALPLDVVRALPGALAAVFQRSTTLSMANLRSLLSEPSLSAAVGAARQAATVGDAALHAAVLATGNVACIRRTYVQIKTNSSTTDPFRQVVIDHLRDNESFRRGTIQEVAAKKGVPFVESTYSKVVKDLCRSNGSFWLLKHGADL